MQVEAPPTESLLAPSYCDGCLYPLTLCPRHPSELFPNGDPDPYQFYNEVIHGISSAHTPDTFRQITELIDGEPGRASLYNEVIGGGDSSLVAPSNKRRKTDRGRFCCTLCTASYTAKHNLMCSSHSALSMIATTDPFTSPYQFQTPWKQRSPLPSAKGLRI